MGKRNVSTATPATDAEIRTAYREGTYQPTDESLLPALAGGSYSKTKGYTPSESGLVRGRLSQRHREDFAAVTGRATAGEKARVSRTVEVPMFSPKTGRPVKPRVVTLAEVRSLSGQARGRLSAASIAKAAAALGSGQPKG